ncbi:MAG: hypothetical protein LBT93_07155 [Treponema sp.]|jgi:hypothetical protein|nr:hypothetical protein [Treponema sp.]
MRKQLFLLFMVTSLTANFVYTQETHRLSLGVGIEGNLNSRQGMALGKNFSLDYGINRFLSAGMKAGFSKDFNRILIWEPDAFIRWYFKDFSSFLLFVQADLGASIILTDARVYPVMLGGISGGIRFPLDKWYVEPYIRSGYPFILGAGMSAGYRF